MCKFFQKIIAAKFSYSGWFTQMNNYDKCSLSSLLSLLSEVLSPKGRLIKAIPHVLMYFIPGSQAALRRMLSNCARAQKSTVG